ncbi:hypothetical protein M4578_08510 [Salipiger sp. P9]|uniref:hypothetical protein n=1 Tax=Salipiger pentaromativorans TaxID=2943193 RepID=UPI002157210D|nr:hypothetical protein [Salipiger pentaromativorans]MCR8547867.1 hypothetical protein [Salipiger pentaromativorans]
MRNPFAFPLLIGAVFSLSLAALASPAAAERPFVPAGNTGPVPEPIAPPGSGEDRLRAPKSVFLRDRRPTRLTVLWSDRTEVETGYRIDRSDLGQRWRTPQAGDWQEVAALGPQDGFPQIADSGLTPERLYCYRVVALGDTVDIPSPIRCAFTPAAGDNPVFRVQIGFKTADVANAGTDDDIAVLLNSRAVIEPRGNSTWVDYSRNDFERDDRFTYDLNFADLRRISDITQIFVEKSGSDDWCVEQVTLTVNGIDYFQKTYDDQPDGCHWLRADTQNRLVVPYDDLRGHPSWGRFDPQLLVLFSEITTSALQTDDDPLPEGQLVTVTLPSDKLGLTQRDMQSRIEAIVGDVIGAIPEAYWSPPASGDSSTVKISVVDEDSYRVSLGLKGDGPAGTTADISIHVDLDIAAACNSSGDQISYAITTSNFGVNADFLLWWLEDNIEDGIRAGFPGVRVAQSLPLTDLPEGLTCLGVPVTLSEAGDVEIRLLLATFFQDEAPEPVPPAPGDGGSGGTDGSEAPPSGPVAGQ